MKKIAWIGTGVMGKSMAINLRNKGFVVHAYNRTFEKAQALEEFDIKAFSTIKEALVGVDIVITMVGFPNDVEEVYYGSDGIFKHGHAGLYAIDMTTSSPNLAKKLYTDGKQYDIHVVDAPVSGGDIGARQATLSIMVGGDLSSYEHLLPIFQALGTNLRYMGVAGNGQHTKMANQISVAGAIGAMSESIVYARKVGLDPQAMLAAISSGAAGSWQLTNNGHKVLKEDFAPGFYIKHFVKDMHIAEESMQEHQVSLELLRSVCHMYEELMQRGYENEGTQALLKYYDFL